MFWCEIKANPSICNQINIVANSFEEFLIAILKHIFKKMCKKVPEQNKPM